VVVKPAAADKRLWKHTLAARPSCSRTTNDLQAAEWTIPSSTVDADLA